MIDDSKIRGKYDFKFSLSIEFTAKKFMVGWILKLISVISRYFGELSSS